MTICEEFLLNFDLPPVRGEHDPYELVRPHGGVLNQRKHYPIPYADESEPNVRLQA